MRTLSFLGVVSFFVSVIFGKSDRGTLTGTVSGPANATAGSLVKNVAHVFIYR